MVVRGRSEVARGGVGVVNAAWLSVLLFLFGFVIPASGAAADHAERAWQVASVSVVSVEPTWPGYTRPGFGAPPGTAPEGSGVVVREPGLIVTAAHVVSKATEVHVHDRDGNRHDAEVVAVDLEADLALLRVAAELAPIDVAAERPATGAHVCIIANAFGLDLSITCGIVSARARSGIGFNRIEDFIQTDAAANPGASGGALVDQEGRLVGMVSAIFTKESDANAGVNFAVSAMLLERRIDHMLGGD